MGSHCTELEDLRSSPHIGNHAICYLLMTEYHARVYVKSKLHYFPLMKDRLGLDWCVLFRETCFGRWLDLTYVQNEESLIHYMLQKQKFSDNDHYDLPLIYNVNEHTLHFRRREFCLISGFKFGWISFRNLRDGNITFRDRVFPKKIGEYVKNIDLLSLIEDEVRFTSLSDSDSIRVCLFLSLEVIFMGHDLGSVVYDVFLRMVEDLKDWNDFPWGERMWRELYAAIRNVNSNHKQVYHKALEINPNFVSTYSLSGFVLCFKILKESREDVSGPSIFHFKNGSILGNVFPSSEWFTKSSDCFKMYTPRALPVEYEGLFGDYLKNLSLARTLREKDREPFIQSCPKVVSLKDRVKALEGLCGSLMILPKEIKSLKARVYKLKTNINRKADYLETK
ncbi:phospholipase-like, aminotransferase-like mobile domain protein [Tanacetum coccineum]